MALALSECLAAAAAAILPPPPVRLCEWAEEHARLSPEASVQPGRWQAWPYQREPLDILAPHSPYEQVVLVWASQMGKTQLCLLLLAYLIAEDPGPVLIVEPTLAMAEALSKDRIGPMFRDTPALQGLVADPKSREAGSTIFHRRFRGGHVTVVGSNSAAGLASRPIRYLILDEVDRFEASAGAEGDPAALAIARTRTFWNRKIVFASSPTVRGASRIEQAWLESDQRVYEVPCTHCGAYQRLAWQRVEWPEGRPEDAQYRCASCERLIPHKHKAWMVSQGRWVAGNPGATIAGFQISELYSPYRSWGDLAVEWLRAQGNIERLRVFVNTALAEWWDEEAAGGADEDELMARREAYGPSLPHGAAVVTAGVDVQDDRLECSVWAWGRGEEGWLMSHTVIPGDPSSGKTWEELDRLLAQPWSHPIIGPVYVQACAVDAGYLAEQVCRFAEARRGRRVWAVKGASDDRPVWPRHASAAKTGRVWVIGVNAAKSTLQHRLKLEQGPGALHLPVSVGRDYIEQLTAEFLRTDYRQGRPVRSWVRKAGRRAEAWDCLVYAYAALCGLRLHGLDPDRQADVVRITEQQVQTVRERWLPETKGWLR